MQGRSHWGANGAWPPILISEPNKVQQFLFHLSLLFTDVQKLYGPEISRFLPWMIQFLDNLWRLFIFSKYIGKQITSCWTVWEGPIFHAIPSEKFLFVDYLKEDLKEREFKPYILGGIPDLLKKSSKTREASIKVVQN